MAPSSNATIIPTTKSTFSFINSGVQQSSSSEEDDEDYYYYDEDDDFDIDDEGEKEVEEDEDEDYIARYRLLLLSNQVQKLKLEYQILQRTISQLETSTNEIQTQIVALVVVVAASLTGLFHYG